MSSARDDSVIRARDDGRHVGAWVKFYRDGVFVIAAVEYVERDVLGYLVLNTTRGQVRFVSVFEERMSEGALTGKDLRE